MVVSLVGQRRTVVVVMVSAWCQAREEHCGIRSEMNRSQMGGSLYILNIVSRVVFSTSYFDYILPSISGEPKEMENSKD